MKKLIMFMLLFVGVLFATTATAAPPTAKDVGTEYSINLDAQNYDVAQMMQQTQITLYKTTDVNLPSEGLQNLKYPSMYTSYIISSLHLENITIAPDFTILKVLKYPLLC